MNSLSHQAARHDIRCQIQRRTFSVLRTLQNPNDHSCERLHKLQPGISYHTKNGINTECSFSDRAMFDGSKRSTTLLSLELKSQTLIVATK